MRLLRGINCLSGSGVVSSGHRGGAYMVKVSGEVPGGRPRKRGQK